MGTQERTTSRCYVQNSVGDTAGASRSGDSDAQETAVFRLFAGQALLTPGLSWGRGPAASPGHGRPFPLC